MIPSAPAANPFIGLAQPSQPNQIEQSLTRKDNQHSANFADTLRKQDSSSNQSDPAQPSQATNYHREDRYKSTDSIANQESAEAQRETHTTDEQPNDDVTGNDSAETVAIDQYQTTQEQPIEDAELTASATSQQVAEGTTILNPISTDNPDIPIADEQASISLKQPVASLGDESARPVAIDQQTQVTQQTPGQPKTITPSNSDHQALQQPAKSATKNDAAHVSRQPAAQTQTLETEEPQIPPALNQSVVNKDKQHHDLQTAATKPESKQTTQAASVQNEQPAAQTPKTSSTQSSSTTSPVEISTVLESNAQPQQQSSTNASAETTSSLTDTTTAKQDSQNESNPDQRPANREGTFKVIDRPAVIDYAAAERAAQRLKETPAAEPSKTNAVQQATTADAVRPDSVETTSQQLSAPTTKQPQIAEQTLAPKTQPSAQQQASSTDPKIQQAFDAQTTKAMNAAVRQSGGTLNMRLTPDTLGTLRVSLDIRAGVANVNIQVGSTAAADLLTNALPSLRSSLESNGISVERLSTQINPALASSTKDDAGSNHQQQRNQDNQSHQQWGSNNQSRQGSSDQRSQTYEQARQHAEQSAQRSQRTASESFQDTLNSSR